LPGERPDVTAARERGWATTAGEVTPGLASVASWIVGPDARVVAAVACVFLAGVGVDLVAVSTRVRAGADAITHTIGGHVGARQ
jgi:DNA-binding IclR family transcriptional regulator